jgi:hypothetical protein
MNLDQGHPIYNNIRQNAENYICALNESPDMKVTLWKVHAVKDFLSLQYPYYWKCFYYKFRRISFGASDEMREQSIITSLPIRLHGA